MSHWRVVGSEQSSPKKTAKKIGTCEVFEVFEVPIFICLIIRCGWILLLSKHSKISNVRLQCCGFAGVFTRFARYGFYSLRSLHLLALLVTDAARCVPTWGGAFYLFCFLRTQHAASLLVVRFVETIILPLQNIIFYIQRYVVEIFKVAYCMVVITRLPFEIFVNLMCSTSDSGF